MLYYKSNKFYSHVICLGTKIYDAKEVKILMFYSHVICLGTKMIKQINNTYS